MEELKVACEEESSVLQGAIVQVWQLQVVVSSPWD
jgi:hypothetical protein